MRREILVLVAACGSKGAGEDWTRRATKPVTATVDGVKFSIDLPEGMREKDAPEEVTFDFHVTIDGEGYTKTPEFHVRTDKYGDKTLDDFVKNWGKDVTVWLRKEAQPDGYLASYENPAYKGKDDYLVERHGDGLQCSARVTPWNRGDTVKDKVPLIEKMCLSLKRVP